MLVGDVSSLKRAWRWWGEQQESAAKLGLNLREPIPNSV
jgi:hypothetical protein